MSAERLMAELLLTNPDDPAVAATAHALAQRIMALTEASGAERLVIGAALARCVAGFWARLTVDAGDPAPVAGIAVLQQALDTATMATVLAQKGLKRRPPSPFAGAPTSTLAT